MIVHMRAATASASSGALIILLTLSLAQVWISGCSTRDAGASGTGGAGESAAADEPRLEQAFQDRPGLERFNYRPIHLQSGALYLCTAEKKIILRRTKAVGLYGQMPTNASSCTLSVIAEVFQKSASVGKGRGVAHVTGAETFRADVPLVCSGLKPGPASITWTITGFPGHDDEAVTISTVFDAVNSYPH